MRPGGETEPRTPGFSSPWPEAWAVEGDRERYFPHTKSQLSAWIPSAQFQLNFPIGSWVRGFGDPSPDVSQLPYENGKSKPQLPQP